MLTKNTCYKWLFTLFMMPLLSAGYTDLSGKKVKRWLISQSSSLSVNGSTNINKFACEIPDNDHTDTLQVTTGKNDKDITLSGSISLKIQRFDCHNSIMTHDLRSTLKEKKFPLLRINFLSLNELPELTVNAKPITGWVNIEFAGTSKRFEIYYQASVDAQKCIHLLGSRDVKFTDFNLIPPRKLGGMIKTNDKITVQFHLKMTVLEDN